MRKEFEENQFVTVDIGCGQFMKGIVVSKEKIVVGYTVQDVRRPDNVFKVTPLQLMPAFEECPSCSGHGLVMDINGEPAECHECWGSRLRGV